MRAQYIQDPHNNTVWDFGKQQREGQLHRLSLPNIFSDPILTTGMTTAVATILLEQIPDIYSPHLSVP